MERLMMGRGNFQCESASGGREAEKKWPVVSGRWSEKAVSRQRSAFSQSTIAKSPLAASVGEWQFIES
jgi:hypothetical protein